MKALFEKEIRQHQEIIDGAVIRARSELDAKLMQIENLVQAQESLKKQLECNEANAHEFECDNKSYFGARFDEVCKHCGFTNRV